MDNSHLIKFVTVMQLEYPNVVFRFEYDQREATYRIWHTYSNEFNDEAFLSCMGRLIKEIFIPIGFFNFYIDLNTEYMNKINNNTTWVYNSIKPVSCSFQNVESFLTTTLPGKYAEGSMRSAISKSEVEVVNSESIEYSEMEIPKFEEAS